VKVEVDSQPVGDSLSLHGEGENTEPAQFAVGEVALSKGKHTLKLTPTGGAFGVTGYELASTSPLITAWSMSETFENPGDRGGFDVVHEPEKHLDDPLSAGKWRAAKATAEGW